MTPSPAPGRSRRRQKGRRRPPAKNRSRQAAFSAPGCPYGSRSSISPLTDSTAPSADRNGHKHSLKMTREYLASLRCPPEFRKIPAAARHRRLFPVSGEFGGAPVVARPARQTDEAGQVLRKRDKAFQ